MIKVQKHATATFPTQNLGAAHHRPIYLSGQAPYDEQGQIVGDGDLRAQIIQVFENIIVRLSNSGADFSHVVKVSAYIVDCQPADQAIYVDVLQQYLLPNSRLPILSLLSVDALSEPEQLVAVEIVALVPL